MEMAVFGKGFVTPGAINRNADEFGVELLEFGKDFVVEGHLIATDRTPIRRVEGEDDRASAKFMEGKILVGSNAKSEIRRFCARGKNGHEWLQF
jgi:hypothetical protein